jgi:hypothetical protein
VELVVFDRLTVPTKPPTLVRLIVNVPVELLSTWRDELDERVKSTTFTVIVIRCVMEPLVALTVTE